MPVGLTFAGRAYDDSDPAPDGLCLRAGHAAAHSSSAYAETRVGRRGFCDNLNVARRTPLSAVGRLETLSDGVFAIVLTLLVLQLVPDAARSPRELLNAWPGYLAYLAAFLTIGSIWLNHNAEFARIRRADPAVLVLNLLVLLGSASCHGPPCWWRGRSSPAATKTRSPQ